MYILFINRKNRSLIRLINSWYKPGPKSKRISLGVILEKLASNALLLSDEGEAIRLLHWLKGRDREDARVFKVTEMTWKDLGKDVSGLRSSRA